MPHNFNHSCKAQFNGDITTITYNLMRVCEEISKIQNPTLIHPLDKKYTKGLEKRQKIAKKNSVFVPVKIVVTEQWIHDRLYACRSSG
ncbi:hypothetical protein [Methylobacter sp. S3L5C]|uniref:hypothetical protein n=1 Tax=Methylobacter sp. S3L5C TaxID=2839024 RepID=UPI001FAE40A7|nr:hypothetical protein [Methylobacter sp. S3L5C]UOA09392.1 hypothetical protein KKZ03_03530 [Methylobacter sp. S3L5C]